MGLIEMASGNSVWCGMDYYERKWCAHGRNPVRKHMTE